jgi:putative heme iron utilization protein
MNEGVEHGQLCRHLMRRQAHAGLATSLPGEPGARPYVSLVAVACDLDASPLLLLSDLAQHSRNIAADSCVSLLFDGDGRSAADPLAEPRLSLLGEAVRSDDKRLLAPGSSRGICALRTRRGRSPGRRTASSRI